MFNMLYRPPATALERFGQITTLAEGKGVTKLPPQCTTMYWYIVALVLEPPQSLPAVSLRE
jgi:hypothetical protein